MYTITVISPTTGQPIMQIYRTNEAMARIHFDDACYSWSCPVAIHHDEDPQPLEFRPEIKE